MNGESKFWQFNFGHLLTLVSIIGAGFTFFLTNDRRLGKLENDHAYDEKRLEIVEAAVKETRPNVVRIDTNLDWLTKWIQGQQQSKR